MNLNRGILAIQLQGDLPIFVKSKWVGKIAIKAGRKLILFLCNVLATVVSSNLKVPITQAGHGEIISNVMNGAM